MNWKRIEKECPKAFAKADVFGNVTLDDRYMRFLYDFFDENEIYVCVNRITNYWWYRIGLIVGSDYKSRPEAEEAAFEKAFEILEDKLC